MEAYMKQRILYLQSFLNEGNKIKIITVGDSLNKPFCNKIAIVDFIDDLGFIFCIISDSNTKIRLNPYDFFIKIEEN